MNNDPYAPSSFNSGKSSLNDIQEKKETVEKDRTPVVHATYRQKSIAEKIIRKFLAEDVEDVKSYLIDDVLIPGIKDAILDSIHMLLWGSSYSGSRKRKSGSGGNITPYNSISTSSLKPKSNTKDISRPDDYEMPLYDSRGEAERIKDELIDLIALYGNASILDLCSKSGVPCDYCKDDYGWINTNDISLAKIIPTRVLDDGRPTTKYYINLPRPVLIP